MSETRAVELKPNNLWGNAQFRLTYLANLVSTVGTTFTLVGMTFAVLRLGGTSADLGHVLAAAMLPRLALLLVGGAVADRWSRTTIMVASSIGAAVPQLIVVALLFTGAARQWHLVALAATTSAASAFFAPAVRGVLPLLVPPEQIRPATVAMRISDSGSLILGPALAGALIAGTGRPALAILVDAVSYLLAIPLLRSARVAAPARDAVSLLGQLREGWREFWSRSWLWAVVLDFAVLNVGHATGFKMFGPIQSDVRYGGASAWGLIVSAHGAGFVLGAILSWRFKPNRPLLIGVCCAAGCALPIAAMAAHLPVQLTLIASLLAGILLEQYNVAWYTTMQERLPEAVLSRATAYDIFGSDLLMPLGYLGGAAVAAQIGVDNAQWLCVAAIFVPTVLVLANRDVRRMPAGSTATPGSADQR